MTSVKLPVATPPIIGLHNYAAALSVVFSDERFLPWFYSQFIQLSCPTSFSNPGWLLGFVSPNIWDNAIPFFTQPMHLNKQTVVENKISITDYVISNIKMGYYVYVGVDDYYIPFRSAYKKYGQPHDLFIFGYDSEDKTFDVAGFNSNSVYSYSKLSFEDFEKAFHLSSPTGSRIDPEIFNFIWSFKVNEEVECFFDLKLFTEMLKDYVYSTDTTEKFRMCKIPKEGYAYGMETYHYLKQYFYLLLEDKLYFDIRSIHLFWEHKKCMNLRIKYLYEKGYIDKSITDFNNYSEIEKKLLIARTLMQKYRIKKDNQLLNNIISILDEAETKERALLLQLLELLNTAG